MTRTAIFTVATAALLAVGGAQAAPLGPVPALGADAGPIVQVRGGCGFGEHRGPFGGCRLNRGPYGGLGPRARLRAALTGAPRGCPPGRVRGPYGGCRF